MKFTKLNIMKYQIPGHDDPPPAPSGRNQRNPFFFVFFFFPFACRPAKPMLSAARSLGILTQLAIASRVATDHASTCWCISAVRDVLGERKRDGESAGPFLSVTPSVRLLKRRTLTQAEDNPNANPNPQLPLYIPPDHTDRPSRSAGLCSPAQPSLRAWPEWRGRHLERRRPPDRRPSLLSPRRRPFLPPRRRPPGARACHRVHRAPLGNTHVAPQRTGRVH